MFQFFFTKRGHRAKRKDIFAEMSALLAQEPAPSRVRKSSPAKRAKVQGRVVGTMPLDAAEMLARFFARFYLTGSEPMSRPKKARAIGSAEEVAYENPEGFMVLAGSVRRQPPGADPDTPIGDIDFVVVADQFPEPDFEEIAEASDRGVGMELVSGGDRMRTYRFRARHGGNPWDVQINLMRASPAEFGATLMYATGPGGWNAMMRTKAKRMGMKLNRYGLWDARTGDHIAGRSEQSIYDAMSKTYKDPWERGKK